MLRNPTTNCGEVEATPVPVVLNFSESFLGSGQGNQMGQETSSLATSETNGESEAALTARTE